ncbi:DNA mismatch repair protein MutT [Halomonadaceae bacterium LMG 33818]|uniref:NUDIX hydrolase n=1 Tax=Cernens ardua TaxID=3402176 RepID=UPI003EDB9735
MAQDWVDFARRLQAIAQTGQTYTENHFELERYETLEKMAHEMFAALADTPVERVENLFIPDKGYATPKVDVRGAVFRDNKVLLVREKRDGCWTLPGGWADVAEAPGIGAIREIEEEAGFKATDPKLALLRDRNLHPYKHQSPAHIYKLFYLCEEVPGQEGYPADAFKANNETDGADFFSVDDLPPLSTPRTLEKDIIHLLAFARGEINHVESD